MSDPDRVVTIQGSFLEVGIEESEIVLRRAIGGLLVAAGRYIYDGKYCTVPTAIQIHRQESGFDVCFVAELVGSRYL